MKLTKADIDKVRHIEGFPIAKDEDIIALSRPPYYTACPNPFIADFIAEHGTPYDEATDDYHREPFAADVSEGKNDPIYNAHSYHTKVPHKAIMRYILHYTSPGDIVFDGFCGTGMTGVAAQMCGCPDPAFKALIEQELPDVQWGARRAILNDLSPAATFIAQNYNTPINAHDFDREIERIINECRAEFGWMYKTQHLDEKGSPIIGIDGKPMLGIILYTIYSDVFICPSCDKEIVFYDVAVDKSNGSVRDVFSCPHCGSDLRKRDCHRAQISYFDDVIGRQQVCAKQVPVLINYSYGKKRYDKRPDQQDLQLIDRIATTKSDYRIPVDKWIEGEKTQEPINLGMEYTHQIYTKRNLLTFAAFVEKAKASDVPGVFFAITAVNIHINKMRRYQPVKPGGTPGLPGTLFVSSLSVELSIFDGLPRKIRDIRKAIYRAGNNSIVTTQSLVDIDNIPAASIDYIFTDPPFGNNLNYSELNYLMESWLGVHTENRTEAIIHRKQGKSLVDYQALMERCFMSYYRVLKPDHWMTVEFHNSQNAVWNAIQEALQRSGFVVADVRVINKQQGSFNQVTAAGAVQQDLVISAYKPRESFLLEFQQRAGEPEMVWEFVRQHLRNVPVAADGNHDGKLDVIAERQDYLLFDRMVAWHIMNGIPVPLDAHTFYEGLRQRFLERDGMFFLPDQVNEYDDKRAHMELDNIQLELLPRDEKSSIAWLHLKLGEHAMTYQEIQPLYMQELHQSRQEKMPELLDMLKENFVQDEKGAWYVPDLTNAADLAKVRRKALLKEFWDSCVPGKGKLKVFRMEAIRAGFDECWKQRDFTTIVKVGERLPEAVLQEDPALLMYYDNACSRA